MSTQRLYARGRVTRTVSISAIILSQFGLDPEASNPHESAGSGAVRFLSPSDMMQPGAWLRTK